MDRDELLRRLEEFHQGLKRYKAVLERHAEDETLRQKLLRDYAGLKRPLIEYGGTASFRPPFANYIIDDYDFYSGALGSLRPASGNRLNELNMAIDRVNQAIGGVQAEEEPEAAEELKLAQRKPRAFIAHGPRSKALDKLCRFLDALGVEPIVVEDMPSEGRSVNENVTFYLKTSDYGIALATADDLVEGKYQPRGNVHIEIGRFQEKFGSRIIYLLEEGASFPSNISEKVWERFTDDNMEDAFVKVARELRAFGLIQ